MMTPPFAQRAKTYFNGTSAALDRIPVEAAERVFDTLCDAYREDRQILLMGNGGSAALASHFAVDLAKGTSQPGRRRVRAVSLVDNIPVMTAYANDVSYDEVFAEQIRCLAGPRDVVFCVSGSGNSPNVLKALQAAREAGAVSVILTGYEGGKAKAMADVALVVPSNDMQHIEDCHLVFTHLLMKTMCDFVRDTAPVAAAGR